MSKKFIRGYLDRLKVLLGKSSLEQIVEVTGKILDVYKRDRSIFVMGNGGSGATASHFACDLNKGVSFGLKKRFRVICLNDNLPIMLAYANDLSYPDIFVEQLKNFLKAGDVVIGISGSGNSDNILRAFEYANSKKTVTIGISGFDGGRLALLSKISLVVKSNDMQQIEDVHLAVTHIIMQYFYRKLHEK